MMFTMRNYTVAAMAFGGDLGRPDNGPDPAAASQRHSRKPARRSAPQGHQQRHCFGQGLPYPARAVFYRGTVFDRSGVVTHATFKGQDYGQYWFSSYSPQVHDFFWQGHQVTVEPASAIAGPAEEFDQIDFDAAPMGGTFLKIGIGM